MFYYYKIENRLNRDKYIGITTDPIVRKNRHFNKLRKNKHFNPHLQNAFNKYGEQAFFFEIIEQWDTLDILAAYQHEQDLITQYDTIIHGYNCNPGGLWTGPKGRFTQEEVMWIRAACYYNNRIVGPLARYFNCPHATINNIAIGRNYKPYCQAFDNASEEEKQQIYEDFCAVVNINAIKASFSAKESQRTWNKQQVFAILYCDETKIITFTKLAQKFGRKDGKDVSYFREVRGGRSYKNWIEEYRALKESDKEKIRTYILEEI